MIVARLCIGLAAMVAAEKAQQILVDRKAPLCADGKS